MDPQKSIFRWRDFRFLIRSLVSRDVDDDVDDDGNDDGFGKSDP